MKKQYKRISQNVITFDSGDDNEALVLAKLGMSNKCIQAHTSLTDGQITYRLNKAKNVEENDLGYRVAFRNGVSPLATQMIQYPSSELGLLSFGPPLRVLHVTLDRAPPKQPTDHAAGISRIPRGARRSVPWPVRVLSQPPRQCARRSVHVVHRPPLQHRPDAYRSHPRCLQWHLG